MTGMSRLAHTKKKDEKQKKEDEKEEKEEKKKEKERQLQSPVSPLLWPPCDSSLYRSWMPRMASFTNTARSTRDGEVKKRLSGIKRGEQHLRTI